MKETLKIIIVFVVFIVSLLLGRGIREDKSSPSTSSLPIETSTPSVTESSIEATKKEEEDESEEVEMISTPQPPKEATDNKKKTKQTDAPAKLPVVKVSDNGTVTLKDSNMQLWKKGEVLCSLKIPKAATPCDEYNGYYVDENNRLVILQTYKKNGEFKIDYTILANNVEKVLYKVCTENIFEDYKSYIFQDTQGKYRIVEFVNRDAIYYANFKFFNSNDAEEKQDIPYIKAESNGTSLITNESISKTRFTSWGGVDNEGQYVRVWEICFTIKGRSEEFFYTVYEPSKEVRIDGKLYEKLTKSFPVEQYKEKLTELIQITKNLEKMY